MCAGTAGAKKPTTQRSHQHQHDAAPSHFLHYFAIPNLPQYPCMVLCVEGFPDQGVSAAELSEISGSGTSWIVGGAGWDNLARRDVRHASLDDDGAASANGVAKDGVALARRLAGVLQGAALPASESDTVGRIVLFADDRTTGLPSIETCVAALGLKETADGCDLVTESTLIAKDWSGSTTFCFDADDEDDLDFEHDPNNLKIATATIMMATELTDHFEYNMSERIVCGPVLYGGRKGNAIVAVLSMRVWT